MATPKEVIGIVESGALLPIVRAADLMRKSAAVTVRVMRPLGGGVVYLIVTGGVDDVRTAIQAVKAMSDSSDLDVISMLLPHPMTEVWELLADAAGLESA